MASCAGLAVGLVVGGACEVGLAVGLVVGCS